MKNADVERFRNRVYRRSLVSQQGSRASVSSPSLRLEGFGEVLDIRFCDNPPLCSEGGEEFTERLRKVVDAVRDLRLLNAVQF
eukprot:m.614813 g.614813  ORF g.614813 m.614813 type:complete len:83 (+) comp58155_c0_seq3:3159-3407(+)